MGKYKLYLPTCLISRLLNCLRKSKYIISHPRVYLHPVCLLLSIIIQLSFAFLNVPLLLRWFHGLLFAGESDDRLRYESSGSWLVRFSSQFPSRFVLSISTKPENDNVDADNNNNNSNNNTSEPNFHSSTFNRRDSISLSQNDHDNQRHYYIVRDEKGRKLLYLVDEFTKSTEGLKGFENLPSLVEYYQKHQGTRK